uniref:Uncharacterized protein n=1 Tax=Cucumis melo TaxID=3656 RepID=A0A9I9E9Z8_CUCME
MAYLRKGHQGKEVYLGNCGPQLLNKDKRLREEREPQGKKELWKTIRSSSALSWFLDLLTPQTFTDDDLAIDTLFLFTQKKLQVNFDPLHMKKCFTMVDHAITNFLRRAPYLYEEVQRGIFPIDV